MYRPSCLIEAYVRPEKYWFLWAGPLAKHPFNFNLIFLSDSLMAAAERAACFADLYRRRDRRTKGSQSSVRRSLAFWQQNPAG
jgi:hypothetical protein